MKKPRDYPLEAAVEKRVQEYKQEHGGSADDDAVAALQADEQVLKAMAVDFGDDSSCASACVCGRYRRLRPGGWRWLL